MIKERQITKRIMLSKGMFFAQLQDILSNEHVEWREMNLVEYGSVIAKMQSLAKRKSSEFLAADIN